MNEIYKIEGAEHNPEGKTYLNDKNFFPEFQKRLEEFKNKIINQVENNEGKTYVHFRDGDSFFLKNIPVGSARPGKRALSVPYNQFDITPFREGWINADYHCVEYLEK